MKLRVIITELRIYVCNHIVSRIPSHTIRLGYYRHIMRYKIGKGTSIFMGCSFDSPKNLVIGESSIINANCRIDTRGGVHIGSNVSISNEVCILTSDHDMNDPYFAGRENPVMIEDYAWIGTRATILPGVSLGKCSVVAAAATATKNVEAYAVVAGTPAKFIKKREIVPKYTIRYRRLFH